jgi:hypothetical protein
MNENAICPGCNLRYHIPGKDIRWVDVIRCNKCKVNELNVLSFRRTAIERIAKNGKRKIIQKTTYT